MAGGRHFTSLAAPTTLAAGINAAQTTLGVASAANLPAAPFGALIDQGTANEEAVLVTAAAGTTLTITRGFDGYVGKIHNLGAAFQPAFLAIDAEESSTHVGTTAGAHGVTGNLVGDTDVQTITSKVFQGSRADATASTTAWQVKAAATGSADLLQFLSSASAVLGRVTRAGQFSLPQAIFAGTDGTLIPLYARGASGQTAKLLVVQNNTLNDLVAVDKDGRLILRPVTSTAFPLLDLAPDTDASVRTLIRIRDFANTTDNFTVDSTGQVAGALVYLRGFFSNDVLRYPTDGSKFKLDSSGNVTANNMGGRIGYKSSATTVTSTGTTEVVTTDPGSFALKAGRRYRADFSCGLQEDAVPSSARAILRRSVAGGSLTAAGTGVGPTVTALISQIGGFGLSQGMDHDEFTVPADGTYQIGPTALTRVGAGSGNATITSWKLEITDIGV